MRTAGTARPARSARRARPVARRWLSKLDDLLLVAVLGAGGWWGYGRLVDRDLPPAPPAPHAEVVAPAAALDQLESMQVKGRAPKTGYDRRGQFGPAWADVDRNGCDTRNDVLRRDLTDVRVRDRTNGCVVEAGRLDDPYTNEIIEFTKGSISSMAVQIDHVVALSDAWQKGAQQWDAEKRLRFANDPDNLLAVSQAANNQKGDGDAATWLPSNRAFRCEYVTRQVTVKAAYDLWVTAAERDAMARVLVGCLP